MKRIFEDIEITNLNLKNRLFRSATWECLVSPEGFLNDEIYDIYEELAKGGVGTIVTGLTDVSPYDWSLVGNMRLCSDSLIPDYKKLTDIVHKYNCNILVEINMDTYMRPEGYIPPIEIDNMTEEDIHDSIRLYVDAAVRAKQAGFDGVQIHLAYQWFLSRFIDPLYNHRTDSYGGNTVNRVRIVSEIIAGIKEKVPGMHISAKFSFFDTEDGKFNFEECVVICKELEKAGLESLEVLGAHKSIEMGTKFEACYLDIAKMVKKEVSVPLISTGNHHDISSIENIVANDSIDFIGISRPLIREADLPVRWESGSRDKAKCISCGRCYTTHGKRCIFNVQ